MRKGWTEPNVRDDVVETLKEYHERTGISVRELIKFSGISSSKFYEWCKRYGLRNRHNGKIPKSTWLLPDETEAIVEHAKSHYGGGYKRLTYMMIDEDVAYASPSSVYRVLKADGLLVRFSIKKVRGRGEGYIQPDRPHREWHIDISYVNVVGSFMFLIVVIDGYSRFVVHFELRCSMEEYDVELVLQRAHEKFPEARPRIISDHGSQFIAKEFRRFIRQVGLTHVLTSPGYPQSNGKVERFFRTAKAECIRRRSFLSIEDARKEVEGYINYYNHERLHSSIDYVTPYDMLIGRKEEILMLRDKKLAEARRRRIEFYNQNTNLFQMSILSNSR